MSAVKTGDKDSFVLVERKDEPVRRYPALTQPGMLAKRSARRPPGRFAAARKGRGRAKPMRVPSVPPTLDVVPQGHNVYRFTNAAAQAGATVSIADLLGAIGVIGKVAATSVTTVASSVKVNKITIWPSPAATGTGYATLTWDPILTGVNKDKLVDRSLPEGISVTGPSVNRPPRGTFAGEWLEAAGGNVFVIGASSLSIVDVDLSFTLASVGSLQTTVNVATANVGQIYYLALDGPGTNAFTPVGLPSTH